ncbi:cAMP-binding domain of CRP or a regulatory subunit of cAMP-dependent protein kinases [Cribrihabitans marinus]|uniref:cAMP-binding domain of CRP or a regulatory subunit of cAMP-dependent protein kinases n=1 Tax=Cribrihabitans marinus TaxID=1227549 RepID=A0A1H7DTG6_9RHOB|nr:Crp/Fnr family transcriptional regulator [Cribrihabitans marinus]SEK02972.1 cAMP-binding domain of CRP or a regulatory subunit of cAMP-dependent protein kinases [Cribrihabitans marinus]
MLDEKHRNVARNALLIRSLPERHVDELLGQAHWRSYDRGETLFLQEETANAIHVVLDGWVKLYRIAPTGAEAVVSVFTRGESFGEAVALKQMPYPVSAEAVTPCEIMHIPSQVLVSLMRKDPDIGVSILAATFSHLHSLVSQLEQLKAQTGAQRVAGFLLGLCQEEEGGCEVTLPYDKMLIAGRLGMKPESLSRAFSRLKSAGVKVQRNHAVIDDIPTLRDYADSDPADSWSKP